MTKYKTYLKNKAINFGAGFNFNPDLEEKMPTNKELQAWYELLLDEKAPDWKWDEFWKGYYYNGVGFEYLMADEIN